MNCPICGAELQRVPGEEDRYFCPDELTSEKHKGYKPVLQQKLTPGVPRQQMETINQAAGERLTLPAETLAFIYVIRDPETGQMQTRVGVNISSLPPDVQITLLAVLEEHAHAAIETLRQRQEQLASGGQN